MQLEPYLFFEGRCDEAVAFYQRVLGAEAEAILRYKDAPKGTPCPAGTKPENVMHARLRIGDTHFMASDGRCQGKPHFEGFSLSITADGDADAKRLFDALSEGGAVQMPLGPTFFATSFGMVEDCFGVSWMVYAPIAAAQSQTQSRAAA